MTPDIGSRLNTLLSSMTAVVIPALDKDNSTAVEQAQLICASLELIAAQVDYLHPFEIVNTKSLIDLNEKIHATLGLTVCAEAKLAKTIVANPLSSTAEVRLAGNTLRSVVVGLVESCDKQSASDVQRLVFDYEEQQSVRDRVLVAGTNFDVDADSLPSMAEVLRI